jgi:NAD(P)-dependent dehydrogenase (short-subunit alcohol dehydrogenase family)
VSDVQSAKLDAPSLRGKVVVVTAAVGALGREHCQTIGAAGACVVVADYDRRSCDAFARELERSDVRALSVPTDITDESSVQKLSDTCVERFGTVDVLVNDSSSEDDLGAGGPNGSSGLEHLTLERWRRSLDVNVTGTFLACRALGRVMAQRGKGAIINVTSKRAVVAAPAVLALSRVLAEHWEKAGVRVNTIVSGGDRHEYRRALVFLASEASLGLSGFDLIVKAEHG